MQGLCAGLGRVRDRDGQWGHVTLNLACVWGRVTEGLPGERLGTEVCSVWILQNAAEGCFGLACRGGEAPADAALGAG